MNRLLLGPLLALLVALVGVLLAWLWFAGYWWIALILAVAAGLVGIALNCLGESLLPNSPVTAAQVLEGWMLMPAMLGAVAAAVVVVVTVELTVPEGTATDTKELIAALSTGLTAFLTSSFISWLGDEKDSTLGDHIRDAFRAKYKRGPVANPETGVRYFAADSAGERWVYSDEYGGVEGWGRSARKKRAKGIADELASGGSNVSP